MIARNRNKSVALLFLARPKLARAESHASTHSLCVSIKIASAPKALSALP